MGNTATKIKNQSYKAQWASIDTLLYQSRVLWQVMAFQCDTLPWDKEFPALAKRVWQLEDAQLEALDKSPKDLLLALLPALQEDCQQSDLSWDLSLLSHMLIPLESAIQSDIPLLPSSDEAHFSAHIKGRKWQQIKAFSQSVFGALSYRQLPVLEWCAGKGHLGRLMAKAKGVRVLSLERQNNLCQAGNTFAQKWALPQAFICADAFSEGREYIKEKQLAVALHACGDLHISLLKSATERNTQAIALSPCCYHLIKENLYHPLSKLAQMSDLQLSRHDLQLPLQHSVIASEKQNEYRLKEIAWRLGFDTLQKQIRGSQDYLPVPSIKQSQLNGSFSEFCRWAAIQKGLILPDKVNFEALLHQGYERQRLTRRIDLVAHLFRGLLERWLLLDRVCFLQEAGYQVHLSRFCDVSMTPRNAFIMASRQ
ncbi:methyltransferase [uncultured Shewanella sp.]|uniref:methyltransferase n=1 Tax=uncultured Shewanella sp. TaxID=173975 RepID=UPI00261BDFEC|nr:methyltransferase [uncultured Shewanella sp.]